MRLYETTFILRPTLEAEALAATVAKVTDLITAGGGTIEERDDWGKRRLAYEIDGERDGHYVLLRFRARPETLKALERHYRISEEVLRYLIVRWEVPPVPQKPPPPAATELPPITPPSPGPAAEPRESTPPAEVTAPAPEVEETTTTIPEVKEDA